MSPDLDFVEKAAVKAGELLLSYYGKSYRVRQKGADNPVTAADLGANTLLRKVLMARFPNDGWLSEESEDSTERFARARVWVVDPLDGTKEFIREIPEFAISIALVENGAPCLATVYNPIRQELYSSVRGKGAFRNGVRVGFFTAPAREGLLILASRTEYLDGLFDSPPPWASIRAVGSIAYKLALLASGEADGVVSYRPKNEWDVCAGTLLVEEAGGVVTDLRGQRLEFNRPNHLIDGIIAGPPALHRRLSDWQ